RRRHEPTRLGSRPAWQASTNSRLPIRTAKARRKESPPRKRWLQCRNIPDLATSIVARLASDLLIASSTPYGELPIASSARVSRVTRQSAAPEVGARHTPYRG